MASPVSCYPPYHYLSPLSILNCKIIMLDYILRGFLGAWRLGSPPTKDLLNVVARDQLFL